MANTPSIRPSRKLTLGIEKLEEYARNYPDDVVRRPLSNPVSS